MVYVDPFLQTCTFEHFLDTVMPNGDVALPSINLAGRGQLVKMLRTLEHLCI